MRTEPAEDGQHGAEQDVPLLLWRQLARLREVAPDAADPGNGRATSGASSPSASRRRHGISRSICSTISTNGENGVVPAS
jgi:hypothetical protein